MGEQRKLIEQGGGGLVAYIPKEWCDAKGLTAGDDITFVEKNDGSLQLHADTAPEKKHTEIKFDDEGHRSIWILINHLYRAGYDRITIRYSSENQLEEIEEVVEQYLLGFETVEYSDSQIIVENVTEPGNDKRRILTRRIFLLIDELFKLLLKDSENGLYNSYDRVIEVRKKVGQYDNFCRRTLSKKQFSEGNAAFKWMLYIQLYLISHNLIHFYEAVQKRDEPLSDTTRNLIEKLHEHYMTMYKAFFEEDVNKLNELNKPLDKLYYDIQENHIAESKGTEAVAQYYVAELARLLYKTNSYPLLGVIFSPDKQIDSMTQRS